MKMKKVLAPALALLLLLSLCAPAFAAGYTGDVLLNTVTNTVNEFEASLAKSYIAAWDAKEYFVPAAGTSLEAESTFTGITAHTYKSVFDGALGAGLDGVVVEALALGSAVWQTKDSGDSGGNGMSYNLGGGGADEATETVFGNTYKGVVTYKLPAGTEITAWKAYFAAGFPDGVMDIFVHSKPLDYTVALSGQNVTAVKSQGGGGTMPTTKSVSDAGVRYITIAFSSPTPASVGRRMLDLIVTIGPSAAPSGSAQTGDSPLLLVFAVLLTVSAGAALVLKKKKGAAV